MTVVIRKLLWHVSNGNGSPTFVAEAIFGTTVVPQCRVTVPATRLRRWMKTAGLDEQRILRAPNGARACSKVH